MNTIALLNKSSRWKVVSRHLMLNSPNMWVALTWMSCQLHWPGISSISLRWSWSLDFASSFMRWDPLARWLSYSTAMANCANREIMMIWVCLLIENKLGFLIKLLIKWFIMVCLTDLLKIMLKAIFPLTDIWIIDSFASNCMLSLRFD